MTLFSPEAFRSHSGIDLSWKIDCDALTDADLAALAKLVADRIPFDHVIGVPCGGLRFAAALEKYADLRRTANRFLIVDDVLTTGHSMEVVKARIWSIEDLRAGVSAPVGVVIFARAVCPHWVRPIFSLAPWMHP